MYLALISLALAIIIIQYPLYCGYKKFRNIEARLKKLEEENSPLEIKVDYGKIFKKGNERK